MKPKRNFASDNNPGAHPDVMRAVSAANTGHAVAYGDDPFTAAAVKKFEKTFGAGIEVLFVTTGTACSAADITRVPSCAASVTRSVPNVLVEA